MSREFMIDRQSMSGNGRPKLLFVINHAGFFLSHRLPIAIAAKERGYDVHVATPKSKHVPQIAAAGLTWHSIRLRRSSLNIFAEMVTITDLVRLYRSLRPEIVHHVTIKPVLYGTIAARLARVPAVVNALAGLGHVFYDSSANRVVRSVVLAAYAVALRHPNAHFIFQNDEDRELFLRRRWVRQSHLRLIRGSGVDTDLFRPGPTRATERPLVILASRLLHTKGVGDFVAAAAELKRRAVPARFALVGEPDPDNPASISAEQLRDWAAQGAVEYWGRREDMPAVLAETDVFCLPSYYREGVPKALIEAAACAIPIVTTDTAGCNDIVHDGENGILVPVRDVPRLTEALRTLIEDPALRSRMGAAGRDRVIREFSLPSVIEATLKLYEELSI